MQLNPHYAELNESYLFSTIAHKVADYQKAHPEADIIRLGIGDVTLPLAASVTEAMHKAVGSRATRAPSTATFPASRGYEFLREAIRKYYAGHGVEAGYVGNFHFRRCQERFGQSAGSVQPG